VTGAQRGLAASPQALAVEFDPMGIVDRSRTASAYADQRAPLVDGSWLVTMVERWL
jgi:hypothetical protein